MGAMIYGYARVSTAAQDLQLPLWLFDLEEAVALLVRGGTAQDGASQAIILRDAITRARRRYVGENHTAASLTVDTPTPFRVSDLLRCIEEGMGRLDKPDTSMPYLRLRTRLESLRDDRRFAFCSPIGWSRKMCSPTSLAACCASL